jgi:predicted HNH restriction endonuclease
VFKSLEVLISLPNFADEIDDFYDELFLLAASRIKADVLDPDLPPMRTGFPEGKLKERLHRYRERNSEVVRQAKQKAMQRDGGLYCMVCKFNFADAYGPTGGDFIEAHHTTPVSMLHPEGETTKVEDIALVCSNCHSMLHRKRPWLEMHELGSLLKVAKNRA